ncbi:uncharacterized protein LOC110457654 [Mizuhopecten yessoensis]|uniref:uncharacterized protein LOC110457654 n=1 Tax=Mizuhopecten yessoensis TaxID=6573 RepID=UPI000B45E5CA|nr:uncharacterized protein LOC110457654 [Mizuhopecten yessoensis]
MERSAPVCSDSITIVTAEPNVTEVLVKGAKVKGGVVQDTSDHVWILNSNRTRNHVTNPSLDCRLMATLSDDVSLYPINRYVNGDVVTSSNAECVVSSAVPNTSVIVLERSNNLEVSWRIMSNTSIVFGYEIGLSTIQYSPAPDLYSFTSTKQHTHDRIRHPDLVEGSIFYVLIKTTSKANVHVIQSIGPLIIDTTPPNVAGPINVEYNAGYLVTWWSDEAVIDTEEPYNLKYQYAIGQSRFATDVQEFKDLEEGPTCSHDHFPPNCTSTDIATINWDFHGHHTYYVTIKVQNTAGLFTTSSSDPYVHDVMLPTPGSVIDISVEATANYDIWKDIPDIDFQNDTSKLRVKWTGFSHPHLNVTYTVSVGTTRMSSDVFGPVYVGYETTYLIEGLLLKQLETYYTTVEANSSTGTVLVSSDGVTVVSSQIEPDIQIVDGLNCFSEGRQQLVLVSFII